MSTTIFLSLSSTTQCAYARQTGRCVSRANWISQALTQADESSRKCTPRTQADITLTNTGTVFSAHPVSMCYFFFPIYCWWIIYRTAKLANAHINCFLISHLKMWVVVFFTHLWVHTHSFIQCSTFEMGNALGNALMCSVHFSIIGIRMITNW